MKENSYVTTYKYLEVKVKPGIPPLLTKVIRKILNPVFSVVIKILGPVLGFGRVKDNVYM